jgi:putative nucleotidyltransferase with HDIG domain
VGLRHFGVIVPLLTAWIFGTMGTVRLEKEESRRRTIDLLESEVDARTEGLRDMYLQTVLALSAAIEAKHPYTFGHCQRVWGFASGIADRLGVPEEDLEVLRFACYLHDIGKLRIPDQVLDKTGPLSDGEFQAIKRHPLHGEAILKPIKGLRRVADLVRMHHEREDGTGYPDGRSGDEIPLLAKILIVSDALDAMVSARPYRAPFSVDEAVAELRRCASLPFDAEALRGSDTRCLHYFHPDVVLAVEEVVRERAEVEAQVLPRLVAPVHAVGDCAIWPEPLVSRGASPISLEAARRPNCWEVMACGQGPGSEPSGLGPRCAVPRATRFDGVNGGFAAGRVCWAVSGALCRHGKSSGDIGDLSGCSACPFMARVRREEGLTGFRLVPRRAASA